MARKARMHTRKAQAPTETQKPLRLATYEQLTRTIDRAMQRHGWKASGHERMRAPIGTLVRHEYVRDGLEVSVCVCVPHHAGDFEQAPAFHVNSLTSCKVTLNNHDADEMEDVERELNSLGCTYFPEDANQLRHMLEDMLLSHAEKLLEGKWSEARSRVSAALRLHAQRHAEPYSRTWDTTPAGRAAMPF